MPPRLDARSSSRLRSWIGKGAWAIVDQALFGGTNFLLSVVLARSLPPEEFGAYSVSYAVFLVMAAAHTAVVAEPMTIFGAKDFAQSLRRYVGLVLVLHLGATSVLSLLVWLAALWLERLGHPLGSTLKALALSAPFMLLVWLARRASYARFDARAAAIASSIFLVVSLTSAAVLAATASLSAESMLLMAGVAGLAATVPLFVTIQPTLRLREAGPTPRTVLRRHWDFGSWNILAVSVYLISTHLPDFTATALLGLGSVAAIAAALNLFRPLHLIMQSSSSLLLPVISRRMHGTSTSSVREERAIVLTFTAGAALYGVAITALSGPLLNRLYAGRYDEYGGLVLLFSLSATASAFVHGVSLLLKVRGQVPSVVSIWGIPAIAVLLSVVPATLLWDVYGAVTASTLGYVVAAALAWRTLSRKVWVHEPDASTPTSQPSAS